MKRTLITSTDYFYKLKPRRRVWNEDNIELDIGKEFFVFSFATGNLYRREVSEFMNMERLQELINFKILCH
jgi:hypothetical protein